MKTAKSFLGGPSDEVFRRWLARVGWLWLGVMLFTGCAGAPVTPSPPDAALRANFGRVCIVVISDAPGISVQTPEDKSSAMLACATEAGLGPLVGMCRSGNSGSGGDGFALAAVIGWIPVGLIAGGTYGAVMGVNQKTLAEGSTALYATVNESRYEDRLRQRVCGLAATEGGRELTPISAAELVAPVGPISSGQALEQRYHSLSARGIDTVLELKMFSPALEGRTGINPPLRFCVDVRFRLVATGDDRQLYYDYLQYRSAKHSFVEWAADDARLFRSELAASLDQIGSEITRQTFVRNAAGDFQPTTTLHRK